ncbi:uncharacterized protein LOC18431944 isoform X1 [Amborella trichopoda]|nr:uncharacterized protein LOC18431944 isoform X1 [Amborella trichopoda]|eukprot:XP_011622498.1 uncharacterized protein LOC18431944 isoform X1 [Amborella trichopoda]
MVRRCARINASKIVEMLDVIIKFFLTSMAMWIAPLAILYGCNHHILPGVNQLSPSSQTLLSGFLAVISVNLIIGYYIFMALKEPANSTHQPDPTFVSQAKASISQSVAGGSDNGQASLKED